MPPTPFVKSFLIADMVLQDRVTGITGNLLLFCHFRG